jgi:hypothetical protein
MAIAQSRNRAITQLLNSSFTQSITQLPITQLPNYPMHALARCHAQRPVQPDHFTIQHLVLDDVPGERGELAGLSEPGRKWHLLAE